MSDDEILDFLKESLRLKRMLRSGWVYSGVSLANVESVADHSFSVSLISLLVSMDEKKKGKEIDTQKVLIMALLHDLSESVSQDIDRRVRKFSPEKYDAFKSELDLKATQFLLKLLPKLIAEDLDRIYQEFHEKKSIEAKIVSEADRLDTILQLQEYIRLGHHSSNFSEFFDNFRKEVEKFEFSIVKKSAKKLLE
ncbi:MAG: HD family hydrolase [Candidatus Thorarchaeota archaeon]